MAAPNCCGCIALLVSGLKQQGIECNPYRIKSVVMNTSLDIKDPMDVGLIQVEAAWDKLNEINANSSFDILYNIEFPDIAANSGGLFYKTVENCTTPSSARCVISPKVMRTEEAVQNQLKLAMDIKITLVSSVSWIK